MFVFLTLNIQSWKGLLQLAASFALQIPFTETLQLKVKGCK